MSDYYDLFLAVDLVPDLPEPVLLELRWLLGQGDRPAELHATDWESWGGPWQAFAGGAASPGFDGADVSLLIRAIDKPRLDGSASWALTVRTCVHEDDFGVTMDVVTWLLQYGTTLGWVGFVRDSVQGQVRHLVRHENGFDLVDLRPASPSVPPGRPPSDNETDAPHSPTPPATHALPAPHRQ